jgi:hypothetical protein
LQRFLSRADEPLTTYRGTRRLEGRNERFNVSGWMEIATELTADGFHYRVLQRRGQRSDPRARIQVDARKTKSKSSPVATRHVRALPQSTTS